MRRAAAAGAVVLWVAACSGPGQGDLVIRVTPATSAAPVVVTLPTDVTPGSAATEGTTFTYRDVPAQTVKVMVQDGVASTEVEVTVQDGRVIERQVRLAVPTPSPSGG